MKFRSSPGLEQLLPWDRLLQFCLGDMFITVNGQGLSHFRSKSYGVLNVKWLYIFHVVLFETGSALCGGAPNMNALILGRAIA